MTPERQVKMAAKMYEARDTIRFLWGFGYHEKMREVIETLKVIQQQRGDADFLETCLYAAKQAAEEGQTFYSMAIIAAAVEEAEPSAPSAPLRETGSETAE